MCGNIGNANFIILFFKKRKKVLGEIHDLSRVPYLAMFSRFLSRLGFARLLVYQFLGVFLLLVEF